MTNYERLCAYVSPKWYAYRSLLDPRYDCCPDTIERSLPKEATDSYLGRLLDLVVTFNNSISKITYDNFKSWLAIREVLSTSAVFGATAITSNTQKKILEYLKMGFESEWISVVLSVFNFGMYTANQYAPLNRKIYLNTLRNLYAVKEGFEPISKWFEEHPYACDENTLYIDKEV